MSRGQPRRKTHLPSLEEKHRPLERITSDSEFDLLRRLWTLSSQLREARDIDRVLSLILKQGLAFFGVAEGCLAVVRPGWKIAEILLPHPPESNWDTSFMADFLRGQKVIVPPDLMLSRVRRYGHMWGCLALRCPGADFGWDTRQAFSQMGNLATQQIERIDKEHIREVRSKIDQKILEQIGPKNLFYQILHGIRSLVCYDHSAALLICDEEHTSLEVVCEQISWQKAKSQKVGLKLPLSKVIWQFLSRNVIHGLDRDGKTWRPWTSTEAVPLAQLLDYNHQPRPLSLAIPEGAMLCAPLVTRHGVLGVLKVAAIHPGTFGPYEADIIAQFLPQVAVALQNMRRTEFLEMRVRGCPSAGPSWPRYTVSFKSIASWARVPRFGSFSRFPRSRRNELSSTFSRSGC